MIVLKIVEQKSIEDITKRNWKFEIFKRFLCKLLFVLFLCLFVNCLFFFSKKKIQKLCDNEIVELPKSIGSLVNLKKLWLNNNRLAHIPREIGSMSNLEVLLVIFMIYY